jgi:hypothetical protein
MAGGHLQHRLLFAPLFAPHQRIGALGHHRAGGNAHRLAIAQRARKAPARLSPTRR